MGWVASVSFFLSLYISLMEEEIKEKILKMWHGTIFLINTFQDAFVVDLNN